MTSYRVSFIVDLPETEREPTEKEIEEWVSFYLHANDSLDGSNPLVDDAPEARRFSVDCRKSRFV